MPNILSNTLHELLDYSFAASMNFPLLVAIAVTLAEYLISSKKTKMKMKLHCGNNLNTLNRKLICFF